MKSILLTVSIITMSSVLATNQSQEFQMGNEFAAGLLNGGSAVKIDEVLGTPNPNPSEASYREAELENKAQGLIKEGTASGMIVESSKSRERYKIDSSTDPIIQTSNQIAANPLNVIGGKDTKVVKINAPRETRTVTCEEAGDSSQEVCKGRLNIHFINKKITKTRIDSFSYHKQVSRIHGQCVELRNKIRKSSNKNNPASNYEIKNIDITEEFKSCMREEIRRKNPVKGDIQFASFIGATFSMTIVNPEEIQSVILDNGIGSSHSWSTLHGTGKGNVRQRYHHYRESAECNITVKEQKHTKIIEEEWLWACDDLENRADQGLCTYETENCTVGQQTRWIDGVQVTRPCWEKTRTYLCAYPAKNDCGPLRAQGCYQTKSTCKKWVGKTCVVHTQTYQCDAGKNSGTIEAIQGGETPFCLDGNCTNQSWDSNDEMGNAMAQLSLLKQLQDDFKKDKVSLFKGDDNRCKKEALGFKDCCKDNGWGQSMSLTSCSGDERLLAEKKSKKLCHFVGTYCDKKILGKCISKKSTYCCYGTKLSRIFHEQGRAQIGLGWGDAQNPVCRGFTIDEIQKIDFSKLDLHEVFEEIVRNYTAPNLGVMKKQIEHRMQDIQNSIKPNTNLKNLPPQRKEA